MVGVAGNYGLSFLAAAVQTVANAPAAAPPGLQADRLNAEIDRAQASVAELAVHESV